MSRSRTAAAALAFAGVLVLGIVAGGDVAHRIRSPARKHASAAGGAAREAALRRRTVSFAWVGDMSLSSDLGLPPLRGGGPLRQVRGQLRDADLALGNLEGVLGSHGRSKCGPKSEQCFAFRAPARYASMYAGAGFDVLNLANNHAADYGPAGELGTVAALYGAGIGDAGPPGHIELRDVRGVKVALLGFAPYPWAAPLRDLRAARALVRRAGSRADLVVVTMHAGAEGAGETRTPAGVEHAFGENRGATRAFAHAVVDAGADLVLGSGPHVVRGVELYRGRVIAYSLGNFLGYRTFAVGGVLSLSGILRVDLDGTGALRRARWVSVRLDGAGTPALDGTNGSARLVSRVSRADFGARAMTVRRGSELVPIGG